MVRNIFVLCFLVALLPCSGAKANEYVFHGSLPASLPALPPELNRNDTFGLVTRIGMTRKFSRPGFFTFNVEVTGDGWCEAKLFANAHSSVLNATAAAHLILQWKWTGPPNTGPGAKYQFVCNGEIESSAVGHIEGDSYIFSPQGSMGISTGAKIGGGREPTNRELKNVGGTASISSPTTSTTVGIPPSVSTTIGGNNSPGFLTQGGSDVVAYEEYVETPAIDLVSTIMTHSVNGFMSFSLLPRGATITGNGTFKSKAKVISFASGITAR